MSLVAAAELVKPGEGIVSGFLVHVRIDLHCGRDMGMTQDHLSVTGGTCSFSRSEAVVCLTRIRE
jgi:hypothetical protein